MIKEKFWWIISRRGCLLLKGYRNVEMWAISLSKRAIMIQLTECFNDFQGSL